MSVIEYMTQRIQQYGGLIVSCQPVDNSPMDHPNIVSAMAKAAVNAGAIAVRIEGIDNLRATRSVISAPIIGIVKRDLADSPVRITPWLSDIDDLAEAGADIIAFDGTDRLRPELRETLFARIKYHKRLAMADCSTFKDGMYCQKLGIEFIGTTLSGYTSEPTPEKPDLALVHALFQAGCRVIAEGRYNSPELAKQAMKEGAWAVTVGSAITRLEHVCQWFNHALKQI